jgi:hypothetical protein
MGAGMKSNSLTYWYVVYAYQDGDRSGEGAMSGHTSQPWFAIGAMVEFIRKEAKVETVVIKSWRRISEQQRLEYRMAMGEQ